MDPERADYADDELDRRRRPPLPSLALIAVMLTAASFVAAFVIAFFPAMRD